MNHSAEVEKHYQVRGWYSFVQEIRHDGGEPGEPLIKAAVGVIIRNPFVGTYKADLSALTAGELRPLARAFPTLSERRPRDHNVAEDQWPQSRRRLNFGG